MEFDRRSLASHIEDAHPDCSKSPTGKHEWGQYMVAVGKSASNDGFFCIHCMERDD